MTRETFDKKIAALRKKLGKYEIDVVVSDRVKPEQLSCEFFKNNPDLGYIWHQRGNVALVIEESGSLVCEFEEGVKRNCRKSYDSDHDTDTFEEAMGIHSDNELKRMYNKINYSNNNWFNVYCGYPDEELFYNEPDNDVLYSLEDALDANWVLDKFAPYIENNDY